MSKPCTRRSFLQAGLGIAAGTPLLISNGCGGTGTTPQQRTPPTTTARVAIVSCTDYGSGLEPALSQAFDLLGGIGPLVSGKVVTVKVNLTNDGQFENLFAH